MINEAGESRQGAASDVDEHEDNETGAKIHQGIRTYQDDGVVQDEVLGNEDSAQDTTNHVGEMQSELPRRTLVGY